MTPIELAWAGGFFDGEGHIRLQVSAKSPKGQLTISVDQAERTTLERFQAAVGDGFIYGPYASQNAPYRWKASKSQTVIDVVQRLWPYLSQPKRAQAAAALDAYWRARI